MFKLLILSYVLLLYFWYFYHPTSLLPVPKPATPSPDNPINFQLHFVMRTHNTFWYVVNNVVFWIHEFENNSHLVLSQREKIIERNDCYYYPNKVNVPAKGLSLYKYLLDNPDFKSNITFKENSQYTAFQKGNVFYFTCSNRDILKLNACPSGTFFQNQTCVDVGSCTDQPNYTKLPVHDDIRKYIECKNNREFKMKCSPNMFFFHDRCIQEDDLTHSCKLKGSTLPLKLDDFTLFECRNHEPHITKCEPGTQIFDSFICEPASCAGQANHSKIALPTETRGPFEFAPGYMQCMDGKVIQTVECPSEWDFSQTKGDNLTSLPMVFDGQRCSIPTFAENVHASDPEIIVPVHEFTKDVRNWSLSEQYDLSAGYVSTAIGRKRKSVDPGYRIGKRFKVEPACPSAAPSQLLLPIDGQPKQYYSCARRSVESCGKDEFFDGKRCRVEPETAFKYRGLPLFHFDSLNFESWISTRDTEKLPETACQGQEYVHLGIHNACSHLDCTNYAFLSLLPGMSVFLPQGQKAQCKYDEVDRHIKKEPVDVNYTFWDQRQSMLDTIQADTCTFGQKLKTGHFVWDSTVYATCDLDQPFVFCPSTHTTRLLRENNVYACAPPPSNVILHTAVNDFKPYFTNEVKRIRSAVSDGSVTKFRLSKADKTEYELPADGTFDIPVDTRFNLHTDKPVHLELRYRATHPPQVAFQYDDIDPDRFQMIFTDDKTSAFRSLTQSFVKYMLDFPHYRPKAHVSGFIR